MSNSLLRSREKGSVSGTRWSMQPCSSGLGRNAQLHISPCPFVKLSILTVHSLKSITGKSEGSLRKPQIFCCVHPSLRMDTADYNFTVLPAGLILDFSGIAKFIWWKGWTLQRSKKRGLQSPWICLFQVHLIIIIAIIVRMYSLIPGSAGAFNLSKSTTSCPLCTLMCGGETGAGVFGVEHNVLQPRVCLMEPKRGRDAAKQSDSAAI